MTDIGVVDYGMGNLRSVGKALESLGFRVTVSGDPAELSPCRGIVFPGVGAFRDCMGNVVRQGLLPFLKEYLASDRPFLGICVGMQLLLSESEEFGRHEGIGFFPGKVVRFPAGMPAEGGGVLKVPHMGWNGVEILRDHPVLEGIPSGTYFYFVHSYYAAPSDPDAAVCSATYGVPFTAAVARGNRFAVQFHPEKSQAAGLRLLKNFGRLCKAA
ncbi:MAG: imidazole glycerol phosphate synthase subunit HisH [Thermodesulfobacteriota bacterium]